MLIVQKYGGTSVANPERIKHVARRLLELQQQGNAVVAVVSAMSGVTDSLIKLAKDVAQKPTGREMDVLLATGEQTTMALMAMAVEDLGGKAASLTGAQAGIVTNAFHTKAKIHHILPDQISEHLALGQIVIVAGFQGETSDGEITTLGRGGSDLTAIALASALQADECHILTDVEGVFTCDPRLVPTAQKIEVISYDEMLEMASSGSKVMQSRSVEFAKKFNVPFEVRSSFNNQPGTIVKEESPSPTILNSFVARHSARLILSDGRRILMQWLYDFILPKSKFKSNAAAIKLPQATAERVQNSWANMEQVVVRGISVERNQAKVTITDVPDHPGCAARIFTAVAEAHLIVDVIVQDVSVHGTTNISFTLNADELEKMGDLMDRIAHEIGAGEVRKEGGIAKLSVVGIGMRTHSGVAAKLFETLAQGGINIQMISTSEIKIAVIIEEASIQQAAQLAHTAFGLDKD